MTQYSIDTSYAYAQLGLDQGAPLQAIRDVLVYAKAYRFFTKSRIEHVQQLVEFFLARAQFGDCDVSFAEVRKAYHHKAMALHPDRNRGDQGAEEQLKKVNADYALIERMNRQAKAYYKQSETIRRDIEVQARQATERERPENKEEKREKYEEPEVQSPSAAEAGKTTYKGAGQPRSSLAGKYMAAAIPRSIRAARLGYLPLHTIIGCKFTKKENDLNLVFDIVMLPENQFIRAKSYLAVPEMMGAGLHYGKFSPPYIPKDTKEIIVPSGEPNPEEYAKSYFMKVFGLD